jgi:hypothetical protein
MTGARPEGFARTGMAGVGAEREGGDAMTAYQKRKELQITLPVAEAAVAAFVPTRANWESAVRFGAHRKARWETSGREIGRSPDHRRRKAGSSPCSD